MNNIPMFNVPVFKNIFSVIVLRDTLSYQKLFSNKNIKKRKLLVFFYR